VASTTVEIIVARIATPMTIITSIFGPMMDRPSAPVTSAGGRPRRRGHGVTKAPNASRTKTPAAITMAARSLCTIFIGISPAGFIMYMIMKTAMMSISMTIMRMTRTPRYSRSISRNASPTLSSDASNANVARAIESTMKTAIPLATEATASAQNAMTWSVTAPRSPR
jgi:hypothetical protein